MKRVLIGKLGTSWVMRVSKPGVNVETAPAGQLLFDSNAQKVRLHASGTATVAPQSSVTAYFTPVGARPVGFFVYTTNGYCEPLIVLLYPRDFAKAATMYLSDGSVTLNNPQGSVTDSFRWFVFINVV